MTSIDRATQVMKLVVAQEATRGRAASCQKLAEALAEAGLLVPEPGQPYNFGGTTREPWGSMEKSGYKLHTQEEQDQ